MTRHPEQTHRDVPGHGRRVRRLRHGIGRAVVLLTACALLVGLLTVSSGSDPVAANGRTAEIVESGPYTRGQTVNVRLTGFAPGPVYLHQCTNGSTSWLNCAEVTRVEAVVAADGTATVPFPLWGGPIPRPEVVGFGNQTVSCFANGCDIVVSECPFDVLPDRTARVQFTIGQGTNPSVTTTSTSTTSTTLPTGTPVGPQVNGQGASSPRLVVDDWQNEGLGDPYNVDIDYTPINSPTGMTSFASGLIDFAFTSFALTPDQATELANRGQSYTYVPVGLSALSLAGQLRINGITTNDLNLSPATLARMYRGEISFWNHASVTADNGGCRLPGGGRYPVPTFRTDQSGANLFFSSWLTATVPELWDIGASPIIGIDDSKVFGATGAVPHAEFIEEGIPLQTGPEADRANGTNAGRLGFVDRSLALDHGLAEFAIQNGAGEFVAPTQESVTAGVDASVALPDGTRLADFESQDPEAYPLFVITYALVPTSLSSTFDQDEADVLRRFLEYVISDDGQQAALERGWFEMPQTLLDQAAAAIDQLPVAGPEEPPPPDLSGGDFPPGFSPESFAAGFEGDAFGSAGLGDAGTGDASDFGGDLGGSDVALGDVPVTDVAVDEAGDGAGDGEEESSEGVLASALSSPAAAPTLALLLAVGLFALGVGPVLRVLGRRGEA